MNLRPGWYPAPDDDAMLQYWDGEVWTDHRQPSPDAPGADSDGVEATEELSVSELEAAFGPPDSDRPGATVFGDDTDPGVAPAEVEDDSPSEAEDGVSSEPVAAADEATEEPESEDGEDEDSAADVPDAAGMTWLDSSVPVDEAGELPDGWEEPPERNSMVRKVNKILMVLILVLGGVALFSELTKPESSRTDSPIAGDGAGGIETTTTRGAPEFVAPTTTRFAVQTTTTADPADGDTDDGDEDEDESTTTAPTTSNPSGTTSVAPTTSAPAERSATLLVDVAKLRSAPHLAASEVDTISGLGGSTITIVGDPTDGWYRVKVGGQEGWIFGSFIVPPADGYTVVQTKAQTPVELLDSAGNPLGQANASGSYALATDTSGELWPVILPEGGAAFVRGADMSVRS